MHTLTLAMQRVHRHFPLGLSERSDYHTSVSTCHWALPVSAISQSHSQTLTLTDSSIGRFMLMQLVGACLCVALCVFLHLHFVSALYVNWLCIFFLTAQSQLQLISFVSQKNSGGFNCVLSSAESGDTYQRQVLSIFSIASGICLLGVACMALYHRNKWVMPARTTLVDHAPGSAERAL